MESMEEVIGTIEWLLHNNKITIEDMEKCVKCSYIIGKEDGVEESKEVAFDDGHVAGYKECLKENNLSSVNEDRLHEEYEEGREAGREAGDEEGYQRGFDEGVDSGRESMSDDIRISYDEGYEDGYKEGVADSVR